MANKILGDKLRELRKEKGFTQQQVADLLGLKNKSTLGSWEVGKSEPDGYTLLKLCKIYEVQNIYNAFGEVSPNGTQDKIKKTPPAQNEQKTLDASKLEMLTNALIQIGLVKPGQDLSDNDLEFCKALYLLIRAYYGKDT